MSDQEVNETPETAEAVNPVEAPAEAAPEAPVEEAAPAPALEPLSDEMQGMVEYLDGEIAKIEESGKKNNYHNARRSAFKQVRNLILPPPPKPVKAPKEPKPPKEPKAPKAPKAPKGANQPAPTPAQPAASTEGDPTVEAMPDIA